MRAFNFSAGPAALPVSVLEQAASEMLDWHGCGMSVMEMSHRGREFTEIHETALADFRELLQVPANYRVLFMQGGALAQNAIVPLNLMGARQKADYLVTGSWSQKSAREAVKYGQVNLVASGESGGFCEVPAFSDWQLSADAAYLHICTNETISGIEMFELPGVGVVPPSQPIVADVSSHLLSRPLDVSRYGVLYGGAQKNLGIAGLTIVVVREDLLEQALSVCPSAFEWRTVAANNSMYNTPPTYSIYIAGLVLKWLKQLGGLAAIERINLEKAGLLYDTIDASDFYVSRVKPAFRSRMNVPFYLADESRNADFLAGAQARGLLQLKGHKSVGGMRASIYNAVPIEGVRALVDYMLEFERSHA